MSKRIDWKNHVIPTARAIVESYDTPVTLRQLFYRLVSKQLIPNTISAYTTLSNRTAALRRLGEFPPLIDKTRGIAEYQSFESPETARDWLAGIYLRNRTEGQEWALYLGVEKEGIVEQLRLWYGDLGLPILPLRGYSSVSFDQEVQYHIDQQHRPSVLLYAGDFDPSGEDILRNFTEQVTFDHLIHVALTAEQVAEHELPVVMGKATDTRAAAFVARHGELVQVELDALPPDVLRELYGDAIDHFWDADAHQTVLERETRERATLTGGTDRE
jgi:hypothetical protein